MKIPGWDQVTIFATSRQTDGFSAIARDGIFENCDNHPYTFISAGGNTSSTDMLFFSAAVSF